MREKDTICYPIHSYGRFITVKGVNMCVMAEGSGKEVLVILSGAASPSPVIETKALRSFLKKRYTVVVLEYLGCGLSNPPITERTVENISDEIHEALSILGFFQYSIVAHSISGVYSLHYANKYSNEVKAIIGIDSLVPSQTGHKIMTDKIIACAEREYIYKDSMLLQWITNYMARKRLRSSKEYTYDKIDIQDYGMLSVTMFGAEYILNEYKNIPLNFQGLRNVTFPSDVSILFILAEESSKRYHEWYELHRRLFTGNKGKIVMMKGGHYLHLTQPKKVAKEIDDFLSDVNLSNSI